MMRCRKIFFTTTIVCTVLSCRHSTLHAAAANSPTANSVLVVDRTKVLHRVDPREVSFTWDIFALAPNPMNKSVPFNLSDPVIRHLTAELQPLLIRISGTDCENAEFYDNSKPNASALVPIPSAVNASLRPGGGGTHLFNATASNWVRVAEFVQAVDADVVSVFACARVRGSVRPCVSSRLPCIRTTLSPPPHLAIP